MAAVVRGLISGEEGQDLIEYALLLSLIALATITGEAKMAAAVTTLYSNINSSLT
jgi:Flp pilus assembly pilin Flp